jgi:hypothetical protein
MLMKISKRLAVAAAALATTGVLAAPAVAMADQDSSARYGWSGDWRDDGLKAVGLTGKGTALVSFSVDNPKTAKRIGWVRGLSGDTSLVGIDYRVQNSKLYGVGDKGGIYLISDRTARATKVGQLSVALSGTFFGVDFNPAANALRVISDTGQNLRQPFGTDDAPVGATANDGTLNYLGVTAVGVTAAAYTNNDLSPDTNTTLYDIDTAMDQVSIQSPANAGSLVATGKLGKDAAADAGFDIYSMLRRGKTEQVFGFATLNVGGAYKLVSINLVTGDADRVGTFRFPVTDLAIGLNQG